MRSEDSLILEICGENLKIKRIQVKIGPATVKNRRMNTFNDDNPKYRCCCQSLHVRTGTLIIALVHVITYAIALSRCVRVATTIFDPSAPPSIDLQQSINRIHDAIQFMSSDNLSTLVEKSQENHTANNSGYVLESARYKGGFRDTVPSLSSAMLLLVSVLAALCLLWAFYKTKAIYIIPEIILIVANAITFFFMIIFCIIALTVDSHELNVYIQNQLRRSDQNLRDLPETTRFLAKLTAGLGIFVFAGATCLQLCFLRWVRKCYIYLRDKKEFLAVHPGGVRYFAIDEQDADGEDTSAVAIMEPRPQRDPQNTMNSRA